MSPEQMVGFGVALLIMAIGVAGSVLPGIPGAPLVLGAALVHKWIFKEASVGWSVIAVLTGLALAALAMDLVATWIGAKKLGATWKGITGALLGLMVGVFFGLPGIVVGPFLGAAAFEMVGGRDWRESAKAGAGAMVGLLVGTMGKLACAVAMMGLFAVDLIARAVRGGVGSEVVWTGPWWG